MKRVFFMVIALLAFFTAELSAQMTPRERMREIVEVLASDSLRGRGAGTFYEYRAARYIEKKFLDGGLELLYPHPGQDFSIVAGDGDTLSSQNVVAYVEGWDSALKDEYVIIGAHYDHLGYNKLTVNGEESLQVFRGADDNGSGVAVLLEVARLVASRPFDFRRSVLFVAFGAEERGMTGSWYFANRAFAPIGNTSVMINLDMVGRGIDGEDVNIYTIFPNEELDYLLGKTSEMPLMISPVIHSEDYFAGDHQTFALKGIPSILVTTKLHNDYHTVNDTPDKIRYPVMEHISQYVFNFVKLVANMDEKLVREEPSRQIEKEVISQSQADKRASYMKGDEKRFLEEWVYHYLEYPEAAVNNGIQGTVVVEFVVDTEGNVVNPVIRESAHHLLDEEVLRVVRVSPKWSPAMLDGNNVNVKISLPVEFRLKR
jgi:TonB family protein